MGRYAEDEDPEATRTDRTAFQNLLGEALALCQAADPQLGADLARLLKVERPSTVVGHALQPTAALRTCIRMLTYARVEAHEQVELFHWTEKLEFCIARLADRLQPEPPRLHS
jgi:hypothetical protein